jgi:hypothetical protein
VPAGHNACGEGKPRALRCRDVPTAVGVVSLPRKRDPAQAEVPVFENSQTVAHPLATMGPRGATPITPRGLMWGQ